LCDFPGMFCCMSIDTRNYVFISAGEATYCYFEAERFRNCAAAWNKDIKNVLGKDEIIATETIEIIINVTIGQTERENTEILLPSVLPII